MSKPKVSYKFYATLLDGYQDYLRSSEIHQEYWGFSENPSKTEDEFEMEQLQGLINRINRVPFDSEAADKGTAFNEVVDCLVLNQKTAREDMSIVSDKEKGISFLLLFAESSRTTTRELYRKCTRKPFYLLVTGMSCFTVT